MSNITDEEYYITFGERRQTKEEYITFGNETPEDSSYDPSYDYDSDSDCDTGYTDKPW